MAAVIKKILIIGGAIGICLVAIFFIGKYTTVGMPYRLGRLHQQIEQRYRQLQLGSDLRQAKKTLMVELNRNRLIESAELKGEIFYLCYANDTCADFEIGW